MSSAPFRLRNSRCVRDNFPNLEAWQGCLRHFIHISHHHRTLLEKYALRGSNLCCTLKTPRLELLSNFGSSTERSTYAYEYSIEVPSAHPSFVAKQTVVKEHGCKACLYDIANFASFTVQRRYQTMLCYGDATLLRDFASIDHRRSHVSAPAISPATFSATNDLQACGISLLTQSTKPCSFPAYERVSSTWHDSAQYESSAHASRRAPAAPNSLIVHSISDYSAKVACNTELLLA